VGIFPLDQLQIQVCQTPGFLFTTNGYIHGNVKKKSSNCGNKTRWGFSSESELANPGFFFLPQRLNSIRVDFKW